MSAEGTPAPQPNEIARACLTIVRNYETGAIETREDADDALEVALVTANPTAMASYQIMLDQIDAGRLAAQVQGQASGSGNTLRGPTGANDPDQPNNRDPDGASSQGDPTSQDLDALFGTGTANFQQNDSLLQQLTALLKGNAPVGTVRDFKAEPYAWRGKDEDDSYDPKEVNRQTILLRQKYLSNTTSALENIKEKPGKPTIPTVFWKAILQNDYIDLEKILAAIRIPWAEEKKRIELTPDVDLSFRGEQAQNSRKIECVDDWNLAFRRYADAVLVAFPHRRVEMRKYEEHCGRFFKAARSSSQFYSVLSYDKAVRYEAGGSQNFALTHPPREIHEEFLVFGQGLLGEGEERKESWRSVGKRETPYRAHICIDWNRKTCTRDPCKYRHYVYCLGPMLGEPTEGTLKREADLRDHLREAKRRKDGKEGERDKKLGEPGARPRYLRRFVWKKEELADSCRSAEATLRAIPLPKPTNSVLENEPAASTIRENPHLFNIITPIDVDRFEEELITHPNRPFVESVIWSLRNGFWPLAREDPHEVELQDNHSSVNQDPSALQAILDRELETNRFSPAFDKPLPGMHSSPLGLVPKPHTDALRLITDHSAGSNSLNALIDKSDVSVRYDSVTDLAAQLLRRREAGQIGSLLLWKADISEAFRLLPVHPHWQLKQLVHISDRYYIDRCLVFGSRASPYIWCAFAALVAWIAINRYDIKPCNHYMDDFFGISIKSEVEVEPGGTEVPRELRAFMDLCRLLNIPLKISKCLWELIDHMRGFINEPSRRHRRVEWQRLAGWVNWALNVMPLGRPFLSSVYAKLKGSEHPNSSPYLNNQVRSDIRRLIALLQTTNGVHVPSSRDWGIDDADLVCYCDASASGLGIYVPRWNVGFTAPLTHNPGFPRIVHKECLAVAYAIHLALSAENPSPPARLLIYTDNLATVEMYSKFAAMPELNALLCHSAEHLIRTGSSLRVLHIAGVENVVADALSRNLLDDLRDSHCALDIAHAPPPDDLLEAASL